MLSESPRCNDMVADLHFPRFFGTAIQCSFSEKRSESRSQRSMQKYQYFEWGSTLNLGGFKIIIFQYIICEPFRSWKEGLAKLDVNLWEIYRKFKCRRSMSYPPEYCQLTDSAPVCLFCNIPSRNICHNFLRLLQWRIWCDGDDVTVITPLN